MPTRVCLIDKVSKVAVTFQEVDTKVCGLLGLEEHQDLWGGGEVNWYDTLCFGMALGHDYAKLREIFAESPPLMQVIDMLEANYDAEAWREYR